MEFADRFPECEASSPLTEPKEKLKEIWIPDVLKKDREGENVENIEVGDPKDPSGLEGKGEIELRLRLEFEDVQVMAKDSTRVDVEIRRKIVNI